MFSSFVCLSHDHLIQLLTPLSTAWMPTTRKSSLNFLIASCSWWHPTPLFALFLPSNSLLQIGLNLFHILQPFRTWSLQVTSQMRRKAFASMSFQTCNTSASVSSSGLFSSLKLLCDCCRCCELPFVHKAPRDLFHMSSWPAPQCNSLCKHLQSSRIRHYTPPSGSGQLLVLVSPWWAVSCPLGIRSTEKAAQGSWQEDETRVKHPAI